VSDLSPLGLPGGEYSGFDLKSTSVSVTLTGQFSNVINGLLSVPRTLGTISALGPMALPAGRYNFDNRAGVELVGQGVTSSLGSLTVTGDANSSLTLSAITASLGDITGIIPKTVDLTGVSSTGAAGDFTVDLAPSVSLTGVEGTGSLGTLRLITETAGLFGVESTGSVGSFTVTGDASATLTAVTATGSVNDPSIEANVHVPVTGQEATSALGSVSATTPTVPRENVSDIGPLALPVGRYDFSGRGAVAATVDLTGVSTTGAVANFDASSLTQTPDGVEGDPQIGDTGESSEITETITGVSASGVVGTLILPAADELTGVQSTARVGALSATAGGSVATTLEGLEATSGLGSPSALVDANVTPTGVEAIFTAGVVFISNAAVTLSGTSASVQAGSLASAVKRGRRRRVRERFSYRIEIDGQEFFFATLQEVIDFLDEARELAEAQSDKLVSRDSPPKIVVRTKSGAETKSKKIQKAIADTRKSVVRSIEVARDKRNWRRDLDRLVAEKKRQEDEEEALIALLM